ncbi:MAG: Fe-Mn family superoxide dismutase [Gemmataceae bacterium]|nr:Fe-Mn family superoxide dismutase [Gemmataceae bacterium]MCI0741047.1 Fe-Mn family superoxide dismutase [Gemmataceae bacterium]
MSQPKALARREVLQTAAALGIGGAALTLAPSAHGAQAGGNQLHFAAQSGLVTGKPKELRYEEIPGLLTKAQVTPHYRAHYSGALNRFNAIETALDERFRGKDPLGGDAYILLQKDKLNRMNSVLLHELYFDNLIAKPPQPHEDIRTALARRFGSFERWQEDFKGCSMAANGWGILARDIVNGKLYNVASDLHEIGVIWLGQPLVVCDVYEHAFYVDYQNRKQEYVNRFVQFLDWDEINRRWQALNR